MAVPRVRLVSEEEIEGEGGYIEENEGADILEEEEEEIPPHLQHLSHAAHSGNLNALRLALDNLNGSIDEPVEDGDTALHLTCLYGHLDCVQLLLERGACLEAHDDDGAIPLHDACAGGYREIAELLINSANSLEGVKRMLESVDVEGDTPLHHATRGEHEDVIRLLLAAGASPSKTNIYGKTPHELADLGSEARRIVETAANAANANGLV